MYSLSPSRAARTQRAAQWQPTALIRCYGINRPAADTLTQSRLANAA